MYAAGLLEGSLTYNRIYENYVNTFAIIFRKSQPSAEVLDFIRQHDIWYRQKIRENPKDPFWITMDLIRLQFDGLSSSYNSVVPDDQKISTFGFQLLSGAGDFFDIISAVDKSLRPNYSNMTEEEITRTVSGPLKYP